MPKRHFADWLRAYCDYASFSEAPRRMHFWTGVSTVAGALRRRVWIDQHYFQWIPNFYIILVAPPGIVAKSTTADIGHSLLREVPGIHFGPNIVTWQALPPAFLQAAEQFQCGDTFLPEAAITCTASELGNLLDPKDRSLVDLLTTLWDNRKGLTKATKMSGSEELVSPWINIIGCTTPHWLRDNVPAGVVGGGLTSRIIFVYAEKKEKLVALPGRVLPHSYNAVRERLVEDLTAISELVGEYELEKASEVWIEEWYTKLWSSYNKDVEEALGNYVARKQTHLMKLAMVMSAAQRDERVILTDDLEVSLAMLNDIEQDMPMLFQWLGKSEAGLASQKLLELIRRKVVVPYEDAYRYVHSYFPDARDFEGILNGLIRSGYCALIKREDKYFLESR